MTIDEVGREVRDLVPASEGELSARVARRHAELTRLSLGGVDVSRDLDVLNATALNLSERSRTIVTERVMAWVLLAVRISAKVGLGVTLP